ncbi:MAG: CHAD domain-containing protein [Leptothrix sp. (in: b-proteobacteria)]
MKEIELKFQIPAMAQAAVAKAVAGRTAECTRLQAQYYDTADRLLGQAGFALRLRKEGPCWVQTLKGRGDGLMQRLEHNAPLPDVAAPQLDLARHAGTPAGAALLALLARAGCDAQALQLQYGTDMARTHRLVRAAGTVVELALDQGAITAPGERRLPVCELEFELISGTPQGLIELAQRWVRRHGLWLDVRSKAERGDRLARGLQHGTPLRARALPLRADMAPATALRVMLAACLEQVLANASELAGGLGQPEHLHQLRVGLRRLRTVLHEFAALLAGDTAVAAACAELELQLADLFAHLGAARDRDALEELWLPALRATGGPVPDLPPAALSSTADELLRTRSIQTLWLALIRLAQAPLATTPESAATPPALEPLLREAIKRQHRRLSKDCAGFATLAPEAQHRLRKRLKRLRYSVELAAALYPAKKVAAYLTVLQPAQDALGQYNDLQVATQQFAALVPADPRAWYALGWLAAQQAAAQARCVEALAALPHAPRFWRKHG